MSKQFKSPNVDALVCARWSPSSAAEVLVPIAPSHIPAFIEWLQEGPPKPKWRITREFDRPPYYVGFRNQLTTDVAFLSDDDVEEVTDGN